MLSYDHKLYLYGGAGSNQTEDFCYAIIDKCIVLIKLQKNINGIKLNQMKNPLMVIEEIIQQPYIKI